MFKKANRLPIAPAGFNYILILGSISALLLVLPNLTLKTIGFIFLTLTLFCIFFFRDPRRDIPNDPSFILSPADGKILEITEENSSLSKEKVKVIKIFLSIFNVHVQRSPISGKILQIEYKKGKFLDARNPRSSFDNESNSIIIEGENCKMIVKQVAGFIARRIRCFVKVGEKITAGSRLGLIQFGSQVDLFLDKDYEIVCHPGDSVEGGLTVLGIRQDLKR